MSKSRNISVGDYLNRLQVEYLIYEMRSKIYPGNEDKEKFKQIMNYKRIKIEDISEKNELDSIFTSTLLKKNLIDNLFKDKFVPDDFHGKDRYYYLFKGSEFSMNGKIVKIVSYDLHYETAIIEFENKEKKNVNLIEIRRLF